MEKQDYLHGIFDFLDETDSGDSAPRRERPRRDHRTMLRRAWDAEHLCSVGCKLPVATARRFKRMCDDAGMTRYAVLQAAILDLLQRHGY